MSFGLRGLPGLCAALSRHILGRQLPKPGQDSRWAHELAACFAFLWGQRLAFDCEATALLRGEVDPL
ncbi:MAG: hypothetical protein ABI548_09940, partial [Polyangiaceae bacterium]